MSEKPVIHIVDDDQAVRDSLGFLLETAGMSTKTYESASAFLSALKGATSGCLITDIRMPEMSGLDLMRRLKDVGVTLPVIVITGHGDVPLAVEAMRGGAIDFIEKPFEDEALLKAIGAALRTTAAQTERAADRAAIVERLAALSPRERQVLDGLVAGRANKVIAFDLGISARTVEVYRANVMTKMQADSLSALVRMTLLAGS